MSEPFAIFRPLGNRVRVRIYDRSDAIHSRHNLVEREEFPCADAVQPHGHVTAIVRAGTTKRIDDVDGLATDVARLSLSVRGADCQILAAYDPVRHVGGVLHAGWRGLVAGAIPRFIDTLQQQWNVDPADLHIAIGPSLCLACSEFTDPMRELHGINPQFFHKRLVDLRGIAHDQLDRSGVQNTHIERHPDCTKCRRDRWWSLRGGDGEALQSGAQNALTFSLL